MRSVPVEQLQCVCCDDKCVSTGTAFLKFLSNKQENSNQEGTWWKSGYNRGG